MLAGLPRVSTLLPVALVLVLAGSASAQGPRADDARAGPPVLRSMTFATSHGTLRDDPDRSHHEMMGALAGTAVGTVALVAAIGASAAHRTSSDGPPAIMGLRFLPVAVVSGAFVGAVIGHFLPSAAATTSPK
jgi:hypothetical protein